MLVLEQHKRVCRLNAANPLLILRTLVSFRGVSSLPVRSRRIIMTSPTDTDIRFQEGMRKIFDLAHDLAHQECITLDSIKLDDGRPVGCLDFHLVDIAAGGFMVSVKLHHNEINDYPGHAGMDFAETKIRA